MQDNKYTIRENIPLTKDVFKMILEGDTSRITAPGQFINIKLTGKYLRRPISICDWDEHQITIVYKVVGEGSEQLSQMKTGQQFDVLVGLGNGYDLNKSGDRPVLIGGGVGVPPLYGLARCLCSQGKIVTVILGFNTASEVFYKAEFEALGAKVYVTTVDGSMGTKGFATKYLEELNYTYYYSCGPKPMLKAVYDAAKTSGQLSFEERMGCGFGACMGCTCKTKSGNKRICKEGPVLESEDVIW